jgi:hypothetical protein
MREDEARRLAAEAKRDCRAFQGGLSEEKANL